MMDLVLAFLCGVGITALPFMFWVSRLQDDVRFAQMQVETMYRHYAEKVRTDVTC